MYKYNAIKVDADHEHKFMKYYQFNLSKIQYLYDSGEINQKQFRQLQTEFFENSYKEFFIQEVNCNNDLIEII